MALLTLQVTHQQWLTPHTAEIRFRRPERFNFIPGQKIRFSHQGIDRDYSLINSPLAPELAICVRHIPHGRFSSLLARSVVGARFQVSDPFGFFTFQPSPRPAVFVATGTGIAPFVAFVRAGVRGFGLLHGVRSVSELYYSHELAASARWYVPCLSVDAPDSAPWPSAFGGRVTAYLEKHLPLGAYDFYLCGRGEMIGAAVRIIDRRFPQSHVFSEIFF